ncbi:unnamed protein product [Acanthosepion pharaonis]|uniref:Uncharacterized protein n=1 Tax=Acanthosepion pharaonis TaxID=158019 RepID=A0A812B7Z9_ACAPH|nr:unnamed protein product [Sepia pharaonis]
MPAYICLAISCSLSVLYFHVSSPSLSLSLSLCYYFCYIFSFFTTVSLLPMGSLLFLLLPHSFSFSSLSLSHSLNTVTIDVSSRLSLKIFGYFAVQSFIPSSRQYDSNHNCISSRGRSIIKMSSKFQGENIEFPILSPSMMSQRGKRKSSNVENITPSTSVSQDLDLADQNDDYPNEKRLKSSSSKDNIESKSPEEIRLYMEDTFDVRRSFITIEAPTIAMIKETYPYLFMDKELLVEFQRVTDLDIDHTIQEYCVKYANGIIELARNCPGSNAILQQASEVKEENVALRQYWDMVTALCLLPLLMRENLTEMVYEIGTREEPDPKGRIVPMLLSKGPIFHSDEFFLVAEEQIVQEFEEFTIADLTDIFLFFFFFFFFLFFSLSLSLSLSLRIPPQTITL